MFLYVDAALFALFVWWFSTGAILFLDGLPRATFKYSIAAASAVTVGALAGLAHSAHDATPNGAFTAFACGLTVWAWQEITFYMGFVTGPRKHLCEEGCSGWKHFGHAIQVSLWHELSIIAFAVAVVAVTWGGANQVGTWTFMVLWWMHESARLNVMLGVRNLNEEFLPEHLFYLRSFLRKRPMNGLFPVSVTLSTVVCALMVHYAAAPAATAFTRTGLTLVAAMMALAILEHWFLVLPFPTTILWQWGLASRGKRRQFDVQVVTGFLGAGKTAYLKRLVAQTAAGRQGTASGMVVLNDFAAVGVDGSLLAGHGAQLPKGCVCCALRADLAEQLADIAARYNPAHVLIEPSGVADLGALLDALKAPALAPLVAGVTVTAVLDAAAFLADFARMDGHLRRQIGAADRVVLNKADLVTAEALHGVADVAHALAPAARIVAARFGLSDETAALAPCDHAGHAAENAGMQDPVPGKIAAARRTHDADQRHEVLGLTSWSTALLAPCDAAGLQNVLEGVVSGHFGQVERMKGVVRAGPGWVRFDVAGGRQSMGAFAPNRKESGRVVAIGRQVDEERLRAAFKACAAA